MSMTERILEPGLQQQIDEMKAQAAGRIPAEVLEQLRADTAKLVEAGIADSALREGSRAPDFTLPDALGEPVSLASLLEQGPVVVTFYRGDWCPYCNLHLRAYQQALPHMTELGATLVAISPQTPDHSLSTQEKKELRFPVLSDGGNTVARRFGLVYPVSEAIRPLYTQLGMNLPAYNGDDAWELPIPGTFVIDQQGTIRLAFAEADYTRRLEPAAIVESLRSITRG